MIRRIRPVVVLALGISVAACGGGIYVSFSALPPMAPGMLNAEVTPNGEVLLTWSASASSAASSVDRAPATGYAVYMQCDGDSKECRDGQPIYLDTTMSLSFVFGGSASNGGLSPGTRYVFFVTAVSERGPSQTSPSAFVDFLGAPIAPLAVPHMSVRADEGNARVVITWIHRQDAEDSEEGAAAGGRNVVKGFSVQYCAVWPDHASDRCNGWQDLGNPPYQAPATRQLRDTVDCDPSGADGNRLARMYRVQALAHEPLASSGYSAPTRPVCPSADYSPPRRVDAVFPENAPDDQANICWAVPEGNGSDVTGYELHVTPDENLPATEDGWLIVDSHVSAGRAESPVCRRYAGLADDDERWFRVRAYNLAGHGLWSAPYHYVHMPSSAFLAPRLSVADAQANENEDPPLRFVVTLEPAAVRVTVDYATEDFETVVESAMAGEDYHAVRGTLEFAAGETSQTIDVEIIPDQIEEDGEKFTLRLSNAVGARIADGEAVGTILNDDPIPKAWLARFGRTVADQVVTVVGARLERAPGSHVTIGGTPLEFSETGGIPEALSLGALESTQNVWTERPAGSPGVAGRTLLRGSSFHLDSKGGGPVFAAWGAVAMDRFESDENELRMDGEVTTGVLGADVEGDRWLAGAAVSHSAADGSFAPGSGMAPVRGKNEVESRVTGVFPYARVGLSKRVSVWGLAGAGQGDLTLSENGRTPIETDIDMTVGAIGAHGTVLSPAEAAGFALAVRSDAFWVRMGSDAVRSASAGNLAATRADANRLRLTATGSRAFPLGADDTLTPTFEVGVRHDGGDAETGTGLEVGAGLRYAGDGITIEGAVRNLVAHEADGYEEWGASGSVRVTPGGSGRGFSLTLVPAIGVAPSRAERLWSLDFARTLAGDADAEARRRLDGEVGYGVGLPSTSAVLTPYTGVALADGGPPTWRLGARLRIAPAMNVSLDGTRRDGIGGTPDHALTLRGALRW